MSCFEKGDKVSYSSPVTRDRGVAIFVQHDVDGFPKRDCILAIGLGVKGNRVTHTFRWSLRLVDLYEAPRTMSKQRRTRGRR